MVFLLPVLSDLCIAATATSGWQNLRSASSWIRADCGGAAELHRQWTNDLEQSAVCTTSTRAVTERHHMFTEDAPVHDRPASLRCYYMQFQCRIQMHWLTYLLIDKEHGQVFLMETVFAVMHVMSVWCWCISIHGDKVFTHNGERTKEGIIEFAKRAYG